MGKSSDMWTETRKKAVEEEPGFFVLRGETVKGTCFATVWTGKANNPTFNYSFKTSETMEKYISTARENWRARKAKLATS